MWREERLLEYRNGGTVEATAVMVGNAEADDNNDELAKTMASRGNGIQWPGQVGLGVDGGNCGSTRPQLGQHGGGWWMPVA